MQPGHERDVVYTYRYLRAAMIALLFMLVFSVGYQWWWETGRTCVLGSISAYYYTPARTIFVGSLCALGACLIAYKGHSPAEDVLLNFSGFMAFVVAIVPTVPDNLCGPNAYSQTLPEIASAVRNNIWSLIIVTLVSAVTGGIIRWRLWRIVRAGPRNWWSEVRERRQERLAGITDAEKTERRWAVVISGLCGAVLAAELIFFFFVRPRFIERSHGIAAITMVAGIILVMVFNALRTEERHEATRGEDSTRNRKALSAKAYKRIYLIIAGLLVVALCVAVFAAGDYLILVIELIVIVLFCAYWGVQTRELWNLREAATTAATVREVPPEQPVTTQRSLVEQGSTRPGHVLDHDVEGRKTQTVAE